MKNLLEQGSIASSTGMCRQWLESLSDEDCQNLQEEITIVVSDATERIKTAFVDLGRMGKSITAEIVIAFKTRC